MFACLKGGLGEFGKDGAVLKQRITQQERLKEGFLGPLSMWLPGMSYGILQYGIAPFHQNRLSPTCTRTAR